MKKFFALLMALVMVFSLSTVAFAADETYEDSTWASGSDGEENVTVTVTSVTTNLYHVLIAWTDLSFEYKINSATWDAQNHVYTDATGSWTDSSGSITIENHSNAGIMYSAKYTETSGVDQDDITITPSVTTTNKGTLESADAEAYRSGAEGLASGYEKGPQGIIDVTASGNPVTTRTTEAIGVIVVAIEPAT